jgi:hypothetical protein
MYDPQEKIQYCDIGIILYIQLHSEMGMKSSNVDGFLSLG